MTAIGFLELTSISKGIEATDYILKTADVTLLFSRANCPGKYNILFHGDVSAVNESLAAGLRIAENYAVDSTIIANVHPDVIKAMNASSAPKVAKSAAGVMEFFSITAAVYAADAAVKTSDIELIDVRLGTGLGGKSFVVLTGDVAAVSAAVASGAADAAEDRKSVV